MSPWIGVSAEGRYFVNETGQSWLPIGHNEALSWVTFAGLVGRKDVPGVRRRLEGLRACGVTCLRMMLECAHQPHRLIEQPVGRFVPDIVRFWDDLFALCEDIGLRLLITPFDTYWTWMRWRHHPYNAANGGPLTHPSRMLLCEGARAAIKNRLDFAVRRWGASGALFAWDLWNEIHPAQAEGSAEGFGAFIADLSRHVRTLEKTLYGRTHLQTVSLFGPELQWRPHMPLAEPIFRHPDLDFASIHIYQEGAIDDPVDTVGGAIAMGRIVRDALAEIEDGRPFLDTEHGPIHRFKDKKKTLLEAFDDEYFRHIQWAHLASGGAGGGMRWPNRHPHCLTPGMHAAQASLAAFCEGIDWKRFWSVNVSDRLAVDRIGVVPFGCASDAQAVVWLLRDDRIGADGRLDRAAAPVEAAITIPGLSAGAYRVAPWNTKRGTPEAAFIQEAAAGELTVRVNLRTDLALAVRRL